MMLKGFSIYGLFGEYDYNITLSGGHVTFIHSLNGYGKSTVMRLISDILRGNIEDVKNVYFKRMDLKFDDGTSLIVENTGESPLIQMQKNEIEEEISVKELKKIMNVLYICPDRSVAFSSGRLVPALGTYVKNLAFKLDGAQGNNRLKRPSKEGWKDLSDADIEFRSKDLKAKLDFIKRAKIEPDMPAGYRFPPSRFEIMERRQD
ncbi:MAG: hypothetical protein LBH88_02735 [Candidatus Methanoplasma sp.]|jgi:energy-coupling factor transporter ATP-binding protein EcfA2|nr:hypothetical protein [Candidatus Methanoplasma sp.]